MESASLFEKGGRNSCWSARSLFEGKTLETTGELVSNKNLKNLKQCVLLKSRSEVHERPGAIEPFQRQFKDHEHKLSSLSLTHEICVTFLP